jgi:hypothetical protein
VWAWFRHILKLLGLIAGTYGVSFALVHDAPAGVLAVAYAAASIAYVAVGLRLVGADLRPVMSEFVAERTGRVEAA